MSLIYESYFRTICLKFSKITLEIGFLKLFFTNFFLQKIPKITGRYGRYEKSPWNPFYSHGPLPVDFGQNSIKNQLVFNPIKSKILKIVFETILKQIQNS